MGPYVIVGPLGAGGMGEVYRAHDNRLGRDVAIKILPAALASDPDARARFRREAKAISMLIHPHICTIHDIGELPLGESTVPYIVMEYLEGETLEERLRRGMLPIDEAVHLAMEIVDALDKAHRNHIVHRDLKPANIMITRSGARLFDFGLAKLFTTSAHEHDVVDTAAREKPTDNISAESTAEKSLTAEGRIVGTVDYLSPEQVRGVAPDPRADIFAFGICLYRMLTGRKPFEADSRAGVIAAILERDPPPLSHYRPGIPRSLDWLVTNCLAKDRDERVQTAHDVLLELKRISEELREPETLPRIQNKSRWLLTAAGIAGASIAVAAAFLLRQRTPASPPAAHARNFSVSLPQDAPVVSARFEQFSVSPDGRLLAYVRDSDPTRLVLHSLDTTQTRQLPGTDGARGPFFSPDGEWIGFYTADRELKKVLVAGGDPVLLSRGHDLRGASWGTDGHIVFAENRAPLRRISASGGNVETLMPYDPQNNFRWPVVLPDGDHILFTMNDFSGDWDKAKLAILSQKSGEWKVVLQGGTYGRYVAPGYLVYLRSQTVFAVPFDLQKLEVTGSAVALVNDADSYFAFGMADFSVSNDGSLFYLPLDPAETNRELVWVDRTGAAKRVSTENRVFDEPKLSPDGQRVLVTIGAQPRSDLWLDEIKRDTWMRITNDGTNESGIWSPDGKQIAFASNKDGAFNLYIVPSDLSAAPRPLTARPNWRFPKSWSPDGKHIALVEQYRGNMPDIFVIDTVGTTAPEAFVSTPADEHEAAFSPDGHWIAYQSNESGRDEIYVTSFPKRARKWLISIDGGTNVVWRSDGTELFYRNGNRLMSAPTRIGAEFSAEKPRVLFRGDFAGDYDVTRDGQQFIMVKRPPRSARTHINVLLGVLQDSPLRRQE